MELRHNQMVISVKSCFGWFPSFYLKNTGLDPTEHCCLCKSSCVRRNTRSSQVGLLRKVNFSISYLVFPLVEDIVQTMFQQHPSRNNDLLWSYHIPVPDWFEMTATNFLLIFVHRNTDWKWNKISAWPYSNSCTNLKWKFSLAVAWLNPTTWVHI